MGSVRDAVHGVLEKAGIVAHGQKVLGPQVQRGEFPALRSATFVQLQNGELTVAPGGTETLGWLPVSYTVNTLTVFVALVPWLVYLAPYVFGLYTPS